jgi:hypothetical protein
MKKMLKNNESIVWAFIVVAFMMVLYLVQIQIWNVTSDTIKPANVVDLEVKTPLEKGKFLIRREDGICPFDTNNFDLTNPFQGYQNC